MIEPIKKKEVLAMIWGELIEIRRYLRVISGEKGFEIPKPEKDGLIKSDESEDKPLRPGKIYRMTEYETNEYMIGDQMAVGNYTATCMNISEEGSLWLMDQYDEKPMPRTGLIEYLNSEEGLAFFPEYIRDAIHLGSVRVPYAGELFPKDEIDFLKDDGMEQWPLMKDRKNRLAMRGNSYEWGWLMNADEEDKDYFGLVNHYGYATNYGASNALGVRRAFLIE